jgi:hypothetical protein
MWLSALFGLAVMLLVTGIAGFGLSLVLSYFRVRGSGYRRPATLGSEFLLIGAILLICAGVLSLCLWFALAVSTAIVTTS